MERLEATEAKRETMKLQSPQNDAAASIDQMPEAVKSISESNDIIRPYRNIPLELCRVKGWLCWKKVPHKTKPGKFGKLPYYKDGSPRRGKQGSPEDRSQLVVMVRAWDEVDEGKADGIGLAMLPGSEYVALDFDHCIDEQGDISPRVLDIVTGTYFELSPSGKGIRAFFRGSMPSRKNVPDGIEIFGDSGFVTVTGDKLSTASDIADLTNKTRAKIEAWVGTRPEREPNSKSSASREPIDKIQSALDSLPVKLIIDREAWLKVCCALHHEFDGNDDGFKRFDEWSKRAGDAYGETQETWDSLKGRDDGITIATLYKLAQDNGWRWTQEEPSAAEPGTVNDFDAFMQDMTLSEEEAEEIGDPAWEVDNVIIRGHLSVICAEPNGGKTTIFLHLAGEMAARGSKVCYINADIGGADAKSMRAEAAAMGITLALPDFKGSSMNAVVKELEKLRAGGGDLTRRVLIFDTLKKMTEVIDKSKAKILYSLLRGLTAQGATVVLLAHTNKYKDGDGMPVYEGTGDLRADVDELIYLIPQKHPDGSMTVSTKPDKVRGAFQPVTFKISADRKVTRVNEYVDTLQQNVAAKLRAQDEDVIAVITDAIISGENNKAKIIACCKAYAITKRSVDAVLKRYVGKYWRVTGGVKNTSIYSLIE